jgi:CheY-like chemotaxis protein
VSVITNFNRRPGSKPDAAVGSVQPVQSSEQAAARTILIAVDDLFFSVKIQETARKLGIPLEFAKTQDDVLARLEGGPALLILDLNSVALKPLQLIARIRQHESFRKVSMIGFVSHVQAELKVQAQEAGCDLVMPRSAFSQNLASILRRHGLPQAE